MGASGKSIKNWQHSSTRVTRCLLLLCYNAYYLRCKFYTRRIDGCLGAMLCKRANCLQT